MTEPRDDDFEPQPDAAGLPDDTKDGDVDAATTLDSTDPQEDN